MRLSTLLKLLKTPFNLIAIESRQITDIMDRFREVNALSGTPVYVWKEGAGLYRQDIPHIKIPKTRTAPQMIDYITSKHQNYIVVLQNFSYHLMSNQMIENRLYQFAKNKHFTKRIVIVDDNIDLSSRFTDIALETKKMLQMKMQRAA